MNTEISTNRTLGTVTAEIITIKEQTQKLILDSAIELGRRLCEAKSMVEHGEWGAYLHNEVDFSQSTANNLMRIFEEYGDEQSSLFGASAKSQTFGKLNYSKALALLSVPSDEREDFIENNDVDDMSTRELNKAIKERNDALQAQKDAEKAAEDAQKLAVERADAIRQAEDRAAEAQAEAERIQAEKDEFEIRLAELQNAENTAKPDTETLDAAHKEAAAAAKKEAEEKLKKKIAKTDEDKKKAEDALAAAEKERDRIKQQLELEKTESSERLTAMQKQLAAANSQTMTVFKLHFETAQNALNKMLSCISELDEVEDAEMHGKLSRALRTMCEGVLANVPEIEVQQ